MKKELNWVAIVPARAGSKRLPNKNLLKLGHYSLVEIIVKKAVKSGIFKKVLISSDSLKIIEKAQNCGAEAIGGLRKKELSEDHTTTIDVIEDLLGMKELSSVDGFTILQCTSPFTSLKTIVEVTKKAQVSKSSCLSISKIEHTYLEWLLTKKGNLIQSLVEKNSSSNTRSQDATAVYTPTGNAYAVNKNYFFTHSSLIGPSSEPYEVQDHDELIDIDTKDDFQRALHVFRNKNLI